MCVCECRYSLSPFKSGLVVSSSLFGALAGSVGAFFLGDKLGRRRELMLAACLYGVYFSSTVTMCHQFSDDDIVCLRYLFLSVSFPDERLQFSQMG